MNSRVYIIKIKIKIIIILIKTFITESVYKMYIYLP